MFTYIIAMFVAIAAIGRRILRRMYGFSSLQEKEVAIQVDKDIDAYAAIYQARWYPLISYILLFLAFFIWFIWPVRNNSIVPLDFKIVKPIGILLFILVFGIFFREKSSRTGFCITAWVVMPILVVFIGFLTGNKGLFSAAAISSFSVLVDLVFYFLFFPIIYGVSYNIAKFLWSLKNNP